MAALNSLDLDKVMALIGLVTALLGCVGVALTVWFAGARERRMYRTQRNIFEHMLQQHASGAIRRRTNKLDDSPAAQPNP